MERGVKQQSASEPQLCVVCQTFYANPQHQNMCSQCFKAQPREPEPAAADGTAVAAAVGAPEIAAPLSAAQTDHEVCWQCGKRAGIRAFTCKCAFSFCQRHRLPETHSCAFDFRAEGRANIARANPRVERDRVERI